MKALIIGILCGAFGWALGYQLFEGFEGPVANISETLGWEAPLEWMNSIPLSKRGIMAGLFGIILFIVVTILATIAETLEKILRHPDLN